MKYNSLEHEQIKLIYKARKIINLAKSKNINYFLYDENYLTTWSNNLGNLILKKNYYNVILFYFIFIYRVIKNFFFYNSKYKVRYFFDNKKKFKNIVFTYYSYKFKDQKKNFFFDSYFSSRICNSKQTLWIIFNIDKNNYKPRDDENIIYIDAYIINNFFLKCFLIFEIFFKFIFKKNFFNNNLFSAIKFSIDKIFEFPNSVKNRYLPFESQPHQLFLLKYIKEKKNNINTFGYLHSCLPPVPTEFFYNNFLDKIIVHGNQQSKILVKYLGWKKKDVIKTSSFRYIVSNIKKNGIYLPYDFSNEEIILQKIKYLLTSNLLKNKSRFRIFNHPHKIRSLKHKQLIIKINRLLDLYGGNANSDYSIFLGSTASLLEALEKNIKVIHVSSNPLFEFHTSKIWNNILCKEIDPFIMMYKLKRKNTIINFGQKNFFIKSFKL